MSRRLIVGLLLLTVSFVGGLGSPAGSLFAANAPVVCTIQTYNGHYLTAVGGGGRISDVIHTDARTAKSWERFTLVDLNLGTPNITYGIQTSSGNFLTAVGGGGHITNAIHSDATQAQAGEQFTLESKGGGVFAIRTSGRRYLTAVGGGGRTTDTIHSDATHVNNWEKFRLSCS